MINKINIRINKINIDIDFINMDRDGHVISPSKL